VKGGIGQKFNYDRGVKKKGGWIWKEEGEALTYLQKWRKPGIFPGKKQKTTGEEATTVP